MIDWLSDSSELFFNFRFSTDKKKLFDEIPPIKSHCILSTSGSSAQKWVALSKSAMLSSAKTVNAVLDSNSSDVWIKSLPNHHVGGLGIYARAYLSGAKIVEHLDKWNPEQYVSLVANAKGTLSSLVPTQVYDLIKNNLQSPQSLRAVIVGGGALPLQLYEKAKLLGWPLRPSYGLTECASQVATAEPSSPQLKLLPHVEAKTSSDGTLLLKSNALLSYIWTSAHPVWVNPKKDGWFQTEDRGEISNGFITILGRRDSMLKIAGELVNMKNLEALLANICLDLNLPLEAVLLPIEDDRLGHSLCLLLTKEYEEFSSIICNEFSKHVLPYEQIRSIKILDEIPRSELGKVIYPMLRLKLMQNSC